jgi:adenosine deaminase
MRLHLAGVCVLVFIVAGCGQSSQSAWQKQQNEVESRVGLALDKTRGMPLAMHAFLWDMPKGSDLHVHLEGAVYAESWIQAAADDHLCVNMATMTLEAGTSKTAASCKTGDVPAAKALSDEHLYDEMVDAYSMRAFVPTPGVSGHDHFFDSFDKFDAATEGRAGQWVDEIATRAAAQNEQYLELMVTPQFNHTAAIAKQIGWDPNRSFSDFRQQLLAKGLRDDVVVARSYLDDAEAVRKKRERCSEANPAPACSVQIRYIYQVLRAFPPEQVFAQTLLGFETAAVDPRYVAINYVQPEDDRTAMADYSLHMKMVGFLHGLYPKTHISLHAGELAPGLVPPEGLCCHIREAVEMADAERIGHGVDVMYEDHPYDLLREMAAKHVMVEINLTSNEEILGVENEEQPFGIYRKYHVPLALSTDDEGVSRIDLTHEYVRAVDTYNLSYKDVKDMVRTGMEHSFLPGASLWAAPDDFRQPVSACAQDFSGANKPSDDCTKFLHSSEKAGAQWELERRFRVFEAAH